MAENLEWLQADFTTLQSHLLNLNLHINYEKSAVLSFNCSRHTEPPIIINGATGIIVQKPQITYLGILIDDRLLWRSHTRTIKDRVHKDVLALRYLKGSAWGCHPTELLRLYDAVILPKIGYGATHYIFSNKQNLRHLQTEQNAALRAILGALKTSPINSLHAVAGLLSLHHWARQTSIRQGIHLRVTSVQGRKEQDSLKSALQLTRQRKLEGLKTLINDIIELTSANNLWLPNAIELNYRVGLNFEVM